MTRNTLSEVGPSTMSHPVSIDRAPRLTAPRRNVRREDCGKSFAASLIRSFWSTPDAGFRERAIEIFPSAPEDNRAQAFRQEQRQRDMDRQERHDRGHCKEVHVTCGVITTEEIGEIFQLHR